MSIATSADILLSQMWPQGDIRDPLGVWGFRQGITGDASGGTIKVQGSVPARQRASYILTVYAMTAAQLTGDPTTVSVVEGRILTNWPNIDSVAGVQGFATAAIDSVSDNSNFTAPNAAIIGRADHLMGHADRFILCMDPRPDQALGALPIVEMEWNVNVDLATYSFEGYGYFWDRAVLQAPGGPRHPGAS